MAARKASDLVTAARALERAAGVVENTHSPSMEQWAALAKARRAVRSALNARRKWLAGLGPFQRPRCK